LRQWDNINVTSSSSFFCSRARLNVTCYCCQEKGHYSSDCTKSMNNSNKIHIFSVTSSKKNHIKTSTWHNEEQSKDHAQHYSWRNCCCKDQSSMCIFLLNMMLNSMWLASVSLSQMRWSNWMQRYTLSSSEQSLHLLLWGISDEVLTKRQLKPETQLWTCLLCLEKNEPDLIMSLSALERNKFILTVSCAADAFTSICRCWAWKTWTNLKRQLRGQ
jgi:hypothetical protein